MIVHVYKLAHYKITFQLLESSLIQRWSWDQIGNLKKKKKFGGLMHSSALFGSIQLPQNRQTEQRDSVEIRGEGRNNLTSLPAVKTGALAVAFGGPNGSQFVATSLHAY